MFDLEPSDEQQLVIETVRQFAENEIRPVARECDEAARLPGAVLEQAHELGLVANGLDEAFGGGGERSAVTSALIAEELAWGDLSIALGILSPGLEAWPVSDFGTEEQRAAWLPRYADTTFAPASLAVQEPVFGSDPFRPKTVAKREADGFVLDGAKCMAPWLDGTSAVLVSAELDGRAELFRVATDAPGLRSSEEAWMGIQALPTRELGLAGVRVGADARLGGDAGCDLSAIVARGRTALAACGVGVARATFEVARDYAKEREAFGVKIAQKQAIAFMLAEMALEIDAARLLTWEAAWTLDQGAPALRESTLALDQIRRVALDATDRAVQIFGGHGYVRDYLPEMHLRNARGFASFEALALL